jgi:hypothetical protein
MVTKKLSEELNEIKEDWDDPKENSADRMIKFKGWHSDTGYHNPFPDISDNSSLVLYMRVAVHEKGGVS